MSQFIVSVIAFLEKLVIYLKFITITRYCLSWLLLHLGSTFVTDCTFG